MDRPDEVPEDHQLCDDAWKDRLASIDWAQHWTAYGEASAVQSQLRRLRSANEKEAIAATGDLWAGLCHQHVQIASAALPALPFLLEVFATANDRLRVELLDIFLGLAITSNPRGMAEHAAAMGLPAPIRPAWIDDVRSGLENALQDFLPLRTHDNPDIAYFAQGIIDELASTDVAIKLRVGIDRPSAPGFSTAVAEFTWFVVKQRYPPSLLWVKAEDVAMHIWRGVPTYFVWKGDPAEREQIARAVYQSAVSNGVGLALEAHGKTDRWTVCRVFVPADREEAERLMTPQTGVKYSAMNEPPATILVENKPWWRIVKWLARKSPLAWE